MRAITIAGQSFPLTVPDDLDAELIAATGCSAAEIVAALGYFTVAGQLAAALRPLLPPDALPGIALADALQEDLAENRGALFAHVRAALVAQPTPNPTQKDA